MRAQSLLWLQIVMFVVLVLGVAYLQLKITALHRRWAKDRADSIADLRVTAEALAHQTEAIAAQVKEEAADRAAREAARLDQKLDALMARFDEVRAVSDSTHKVVHREFDGAHDTDAPTKDQISEIRAVTQEINDKMSHES